MVDISKLPGVTNAWPSMPIKSSYMKDKKNKKENNKDKKNSNDNNSDKGTEHIDEYA